MGMLFVIPTAGNTDHSGLYGKEVSERARRSQRF